MIKFATMALALAGLIPASAALAQSAGSGAAIRAFSGYGHPDIGADVCKSVNPTTTECVIPAGVAGRYAIEADGTSTALNAKAVQAMVIRGDDWVCAQYSTRQDPAKPWASGPRTLKVGCVLNLLADNPVTVRVIYGDSNAKKDAAGPVVTIKALPWDGVVQTQAAGAAVK